MKKSNILLLAVMAICALFLTSYESGPAHHSGLDCTGAETDNGNPTGCSTGNCHGNTATTGIVVTLELDSAGTPVTSYKGGLNYTVKLTGTNTTTNTEPDFGFQMACITGSTPSASPVNAGTWQQSGLPTGVRYSPAQSGSFMANVVEHSTALSATSGTGGSGTVYTVSVNWTAPAAGTGTVSIWAVLNATDGLDVASGFLDFWNTKTLVLQEDTSTATSINATGNELAVNIYPNPTTDFVEVELNNAAYGPCSINAYDAEGRKVLSAVKETEGNSTKAVLNTGNWQAGIYLLQITQGSNQKVIRLVKN